MNKIFYISLAVVLSILPAYIFPDKILEWTAEDGIYEWLGALSFLAASILIGITVIGARTRSNKYVALILSLFFFVSFAEEISWGQRIWHVKTPELMQKHNMQQEINLHNLSWFHGKKADKSDKEGLAKLLTAKRLFIYICLTYYLFLPLVIQKSTRARNILKKWPIPLVPVSIGVLFISVLAICKISQHIFFADNMAMHSPLVEIMEFHFGVIALAAGLSIFKSRSHLKSMNYFERKSTSQLKLSVK